jgi:chorismate mutase/prephenate dehydratase
LTQQDRKRNPENHLRRSLSELAMAKKKASKKKLKTGKSAKPTRQQKAVARPKSASRKATTHKAPAKKAPAKVRAAKSVSPEAELRLVDQEILKLINRRARLTTSILEAQPNPQKAVFDPSGDAALWKLLEETNPGPLPSESVCNVFRSVLSSARQQIKSQRVAYLGPKFSFTHLAAIERFGESADLVPVNTIATVFEEVNRGHTEYGLVPIENSTDGRVVDTLDMFTRLPLRICGEVLISIHHNLLARTPRSEITEIYSKPQALSQCRDWLAKNMPDARTIEVTSTSTAAQLARDKHGAAAVASQQAAVQYDLQIVADKIEDNKNNVTRFAVIGEDVVGPTGRDRTAILLRIQHKPGALADSLVAFKNSRVNLTWIESFPLRGTKPGYLFFLDFEGHIEDSKVRKTIADLEQHATKVEVLGSYPRSNPL